MDGRSATVMPWEGLRTSNTGPSIGPLTRTQTTAAATRPTATQLRRLLENLEKCRRAGLPRAGGEAGGFGEAIVAAGGRSCGVRLSMW